MPTAARDSCGSTACSTPAGGARRRAHRDHSESGRRPGRRHRAGAHPHVRTAVLPRRVALATNACPQSNGLWPGATMSERSRCCWPPTSCGPLSPLRRTHRSLTMQERRPPGTSLDTHRKRSGMSDLLAAQDAGDSPPRRPLSRTESVIRAPGPPETVLDPAWSQGVNAPALVDP